tara:strand:+ start:20 stop:994 length:975 start_codon:yes stop_codon:yes gene_type:complete
MSKNGDQISKVRFKFTFAKSRNKAILSNEGGIVLDWFDVIKVEDIDFELDNQARGFGYFTFEPISPDKFDKLLDNPNKTVLDFLEKKIRINPANIYKHLKERLGKEPTEEQIMEWVKRTIMHEATHGAMAEEQFEMADQQTEYGAFTGQFPESTYLRIKQYLKHPATREGIINQMGAMFLGLDSGSYEKNSTRVLREIMEFVDSITDEIKNKKDKEEARELLTRLEVLARKAGKPHIREIDVHDINTLINRYGVEFEDVILELFKNILGYDAEEIDFSRERAKDFGGMFELGKQATTVMSTTAGFESRPRYGKKKEEEEDGKRN